MCPLTNLQDRDTDAKVVRREILDVNALALALVRIFHDEPNFAYRISNEEKRRQLLFRFFRLAIRVSQIYGETYTTEDADSCALWIRPEHNVTLGRMVRPGLPTAHWYLMALGVESSEEEDAIGAALIEPILSRADSTGVSCYLETFNEQRLRFFKDHGFRIMGAGQIGREGPQFWTMVRPARVSLRVGLLGL
jgi:hypothetical protein